MNQSEYWKKTHQKYAIQPWIGKPNIFAKEVSKYFPKCGKVLDLGGGQGQDSQYFLAHGYEVVLTDISNYALKIAKKKIGGKKSKVIFKNVDLVKRLPFKKNEFDVVYSHLALHYFDDKTTRRLFKEIHRISKPGGLVAFIVNTKNDPEIRNTDYKKLQSGYYQDPFGLKKRYFSQSEVGKLIKGLFKPIIIDSHGETHKDSIKTLIRFVGIKINS